MLVGFGDLTGFAHILHACRRVRGKRLHRVTGPAGAFGDPHLLKNAVGARECVQESLPPPHHLHPLKARVDSTPSSISHLLPPAVLAAALDGESLYSLVHASCLDW